VPPNSKAISKLHAIRIQKTVPFTATAIRTSNPTMIPALVLLDIQLELQEHLCLHLGMFEVRYTRK
jgi:hypothetical protein